MITLYLARTDGRRAFAERLLRERYAVTAPLIESANGKPFFEGHPLFFNLSHSGGMLALAVSDAEVGVDIQRRKAPPSAILGRLTDAERQEDFFDLWTAKEAFIKLRGETLARMLPRLAYEKGALALDGAPATVCIKHVPLDGFSLCVCSETEQEVEIVEL